MKTPQPKIIGTTELWSARLHFDSPRSVVELQNSVTEYVTESGITVVGYYVNNPSSLTLLRWPETRDGHRTPTIPECYIAMEGLAVKLQATNSVRNVISAGVLHTMMGRKRGGYNDGEIAPLSELAREGLASSSPTEAHMVSARTVEGAAVEHYGEPVGILIVDPMREAEIHQIGENLEQWHYAIERGIGTAGGGLTNFYETPWARVE